MIKSAPPSHVEIHSLYELAQMKDKKTKLPFLKDMIKRMNNPDQFRALKSGYTLLDKWIGGFEKGALIIISARPGVGKTNILLNLILNFLKQNDKHNLMFSLEMTRKQNLLRLLAMKNGYKYSDLRDLNPTASFWKDFEKEDLLEPFKKIHLMDIPRMSIQEISSHIKGFCERKLPLNAVLIDHINLLYSESSKVRSNTARYEEVGTISRDLKISSVFHDLPIIAVCQASRETDKGTKTPKMSDLRESANLESDADVVIFVTKQPHQRGRIHEIILHLLKARDSAGGGAAQIRLYLDTETLKISNDPTIPKF